MAGQENSGYQLREGGVKYDGFFKRWTVGEHKFEYPQMADAFVFCWKAYGPAIAIKVKDELKSKLETTIAKFVGTKVKEEAVGAVQDFLLGKAIAPMPTPVGIALKLIDAAVVVVGDAYMKGDIEQKKRLGLYTNMYTPAHDLDKYCDYVLYSWFMDPVNGPYYRTYALGPKPL